MKKITIYECNDGTRFDSEKQALEYDVLLSICNSINDVIGRKVELEYNQYVQRNAETVKKQWRVFCNIVAEYIPDYTQIAKECGNGTRHRSHIGIKRSTVNTRVRMCGWSYEQALTTPVRAHKKYKERLKSLCVRV